MAYKLGDLAKQGGAHHQETHRANHQSRGHMSPVGGGRPDPFIIRRDEDVASAPMERTKAGAVPRMNRVGGITGIKGRKPMGSV